MTIDLEEMRQKKAFEDLQAAKGIEPQEVTTAFLVVQYPNGQWVAMHDYAGKDFVLERTAILDDIISGSATIGVGCAAQQTAMNTMMLMQQQAMQMQQAAQSQQIASLIDPKKLRV